jgi:3-carboxy-cis,cis-muconate cycloisomerase
MSLPPNTDFLTVCAGGEAFEACFSSPALLQHMLAFEVALAETQAELGLIPAASAASIARAAQAERFDVAALVAATRDSATPAIPVVRALCAAVSGEDLTAAGHVHLGATSQDVVDTALMLAMLALSN